MKLTIAFPLILSICLIVLAREVYTSGVPRFVVGSDSIAVPRYVDSTVGQALASAEVQRLQVEVKRVPTEHVEQDIVIAQDPPAGTYVERGDVLQLTVSAGVQPPNLVGLTVDQARVELLLAGWEMAPEVERRLVGGPPDVVVAHRPSASEPAADKVPVTVVVGAHNLAFGHAVHTSAGGQAPEAVDGNPETVAWPPGGLPHWVEVDLGVPVTVTGVELLAAAEQPGEAIVEIWAWDAGNSFFALHTFREMVGDDSILSVSLVQPAHNITRLRVATTGGRPIGWREIGVAQ